MKKLVCDKKNLINGCIFAGLLCLVLFAVFVRCFLSDPLKKDHSIVIRYSNETLLIVPAHEDREIVIRDGKIADAPLHLGKENVLVIKDGSVSMISATCPGGDCIAQGAVDASCYDRRPLGRWIICSPHRISVEYTGD